MSRPAAMDPLVGSVLGDRYEVLRRIAKGGMGTIYEVRNIGLGRSFALKTLDAEAAEDLEVLGRLGRGASRGGSPGGGDRAEAAAPEHRRGRRLGQPRRRPAVPRDGVPARRAAG